MTLPASFIIIFFPTTFFECAVGVANIILADTGSGVTVGLAVGTQYGDGVGVCGATGVLNGDGVGVCGAIGVLNGGAVGVGVAPCQ